MKPRKTFYGVTFYPISFKLLPLWARRSVGATLPSLVRWRYSNRAKEVGSTKDEMVALLSEFTYSENDLPTDKYIDRIPLDWNPLGHITYNPFNFITSLYYFCLYSLVRKVKPEVAVESGVFLGGSSCAILKAMEENGRGKLISVDISPDATAGDRSYSFPTGFAVPDELRGRWKLVIEDSRHFLPEFLEKQGKIDFFLHDSDHSYETMTFEMGQGYGHLREGGIMVVDDASTTLAVYDFARSMHLKPWILSRDGIYPDNLAVFLK